jgi:hypothetical protein
MRRTLIQLRRAHAEHGARVSTCTRTARACPARPGCPPTGSFNRWGDYSEMSVDPVDGCTFWYTTEYYAVTGADWQTRVGAFKFPGCA